MKYTHSMDNLNNILFRIKLDFLACCLITYKLNYQNLS